MLSTHATKTINLSMAAYIHKDHEESVEMAAQEKAMGTLSERALGDLSIEHIQLVPQARNRLTKEGFEKIAQILPNTKFRLHANTRVLKEHRLVDLSGFQDNKEYFQALADFSNWMKAPAYSLHSGRKKECKKTKLIDNLNAVQEMFNCPVAIEPQYPSASGLLIDTWIDHEWLLRQDVPFALDLSHLNIVAHKSGHLPIDLVEEMLASKNCIEVHVSSNSGATDAHQQCNEKQWWSEILPKTNPTAVIFSEGSRYRPFNEKGTNAKLEKRTEEGK